MKKIMLAVSVCIVVAALSCRLSPPEAAGARLGWVADVPMAQARAKAENKLVLLDFTGSDWCVWCKKLDKEIFSTPAFSDYATNNLVLVEVDFPHGKAQAPDLKKANDALLAKYKVEGFPTIIVLDAEGKKVGELGYMEGGPKAFIAELAKLKKS